MYSFYSVNLTSSFRLQWSRLSFTVIFTLYVYGLWLFLPKFQQLCTAWFITPTPRPVRLLSLAASGTAPVAPLTLLTKRHQVRICRADKAFHYLASAHASNQPYFSVLCFLWIKFWGQTGGNIHWVPTANMYLAIRKVVKEIAEVVPPQRNSKPSEDEINFSNELKSYS